MYTRNAASHRQQLHAGRRSNGSAATRTMAVFGVLLFLLSACAVMPGSDVEAIASPVPEGGDYAYVMTYDGNNILITNVEVWEGTTKVDNSRTFRQLVGGEWKMGEYWGFDDSTGLGPFNTFYAAINLYSGANADDLEEPRLSTDVGGIAYVLSPSNLKSTLSGTTFTGSLYNIMLVIPTVYWVADANHLYISNRDIGGTALGAYTVPAGMKAYAHTFDDLAQFTNAPFPYIAIGVYEASTINIDGEAAMVSQSGKAQAYGNRNDLKDYADHTPSGPNADYQMMNFYHWTLSKIMIYTVTGSKNVQAMVGHGPVSLKAMPETGRSDGAGWVGAGDDYSKVFLENMWGGTMEMIGDAYMNKTTLRVGNNLGGSQMTINEKWIEGIYSSKQGRVTKTNTASEYWDLPRNADGDISGHASYGTVDETKISDIIAYNSATHTVILTGGYFNEGSAAGLSRVNAGSNASFNTNGGARLSYAMAGFSVTYDAGEGSGSVTDTGKYPAGVGTVLKSKDGLVAPPDKAFIGWELDGTIYPEGAEITMGTGGLYLTAAWDYPYTEIVFDMNGGSGDPMANQIIGPGKSTALSKCTYSRDDYTFAGWSETPAGDALYTDGQRAVFETSSVVVKRLYAVWEGFYNVSFDTGKGSLPAPGSFDIGAGTTFSVPEYYGTLKDHSFGGWNDGSRTVQPGDIYRMGHGNVVLSAVWIADEEKAEYPEEDEDDIFRLLDNGRMAGSQNDRSMLWIVVAASAVAVAAAAVMVVALRKP